MNVNLQNKFTRPSKDLNHGLEGSLESVLATFDKIGVGCLVVSRSGQITSRNETFDQLNLDLCPGWLRSRSRTTDQVIKDALERTASVALRVSRKLPELGMRFVIHRLKVESARDTFLVTFHPLKSKDKSAPLKWFSPVDVGILECIAQGHNLRETASVVNIPYNTVRKYVQNMLTKTSCRTQAHLVAQYLNEKNAPSTVAASTGNGDAGTDKRSTAPLSDRALRRSGMS